MTATYVKRDGGSFLHLRDEFGALKESAGLFWTMAAVSAAVRYPSVGGITSYEANRR